MNPQEIATLLSQKFGERIIESKPDELNPWSSIEPSAMLEAAQFLRDDGRLSLDHLELLSGVDFKDRIEVVYVLYSMKHHHRYTIKCPLSREEPSVPSVESLWGVANWHEREAYDMFGIVFEGHSDLSRILCPDDWEGYPLRKDYVFPKTYRDMPV
jgi:NADH-quinone oxidoreductase subunit C